MITLPLPSTKSSFILRSPWELKMTGFISTLGKREEGE